ncbi:NYN domain-containing protein [Arenimonas oryziterrae]|uniref:HTH OST-type domain-containing protein n=1 Tax=Arenimonas oryziterrae DSM 21050 = YC6267 TaxID=1121015 RepID=A0A091AX99_9GAMM|nr:NYN domain-containing protein [Arenimonas oryziterrae]KFN43902.1 hypothetical protein N789_08110 [Arenimonas oryziterrae DSM 21050 = YC6267]
MKTRPAASASDQDHRRLAVLIDADNAQPSVIEGLLAEIAKFGVASVKRIYGDFTSTHQTQWKKALLKHSIQPVQQFAYTSGKNATDSSLIIDAMDLMYTRSFDGFCLVSSDSDFTRLAQRLREAGLLVYGFGEQKTPDAFVQACDKFVYTEVLRSEVAAVPAPVAKPTPNPAPAKKAVAGKPKAPDKIETPIANPIAVGKHPLPAGLIRQAIEEGSDDQGWAFLGTVGSYLNKIRPDFDARLYGHKKLRDLLKAHPALFELQERGSADTPAKAIYVRALKP